MSTLYVLIALVLLGSFSIGSEEICDCEEKPKCPKTKTVTECPGGRGMLMVPGGADCSCCEAVCPKRKGERCDEHRLSCEHGLSCTDAGICGEDANSVELTALSASNDSLTLGWRGPSGYVVQYREVRDGKDPGQWRKYDKLTESPESNITLSALSPGMMYEARALLPGGESDGPSAAVRAETGCECPRPFFRIGSFKGDSFCTERTMPDKPCCALVMCADSHSNDEPSTVSMESSDGFLRSDASEISMTSIPVNKTSSCTHKNRTLAMGEVFYDGCELKCTCGEDATVKCEPRCEEMSHNISSKCVSLPDPKDACCTIILCDVTLGDQEATSTQGDAMKPSDMSTTTSTPALQQSEGAGVCTFNGRSYAAEEEFHDGCKALCYCSPSGEVECAPLVCPTDSGLDVLDPHCIDWETVPNDPSELEGPTPTCCPQVRCRSNGSCEYGGERYDNYAELPASVSENCSSNRCFCEFGNVTCGGGGTSKCTPISPYAPRTLSCKDGGPETAILAHPSSDTCCLVWVCPEDAHQPSTQSPEPGSTNSSSEDAVPETMMIPTPDEVTVSTNDKPRPMTTTSSTLTHPLMDTDKNHSEINDTTILTDRGNFDTESNITSEVPTQIPVQTTSHGSSAESNTENVTMSLNTEKEIMSTEGFTPTPSSTQKINIIKESTTITMNGTDMAATKESTMRPIVVKEHSIYTSPWGNIVSIPQDNERPNNIFLPTVPPTQIPAKDPVHEVSPLSEENKSEYFGIPYAPEYQGPWAIRPEKQPQPAHPFNVIHTTPDEMPIVVPRHPFVDEGIPNAPDHHDLGHMIENGRIANKTSERPKQQDDTPIFLRYPVQEGKKQKTVPQKGRIPQHPGDIPSNLNEFHYQGPFLEIPPSGHDDQVLFQPHEGNVRPINNLPRPINKNSNNRQQPLQGGQPNFPQNIPGRNGFPNPHLIQQVPPNIPPHVHRPLPPGGVRQPQNVPTPDQFQIQGLDGENIPPEVAQHILWALQGRAPPGQRVPQHPSQQLQQNQRIPQRGRPQEVFFHVPSGPGVQPHPDDFFAQNGEPPRQRIPSRIPPIPTNQHVPPHQNGQFSSGPPQFLPGVEHSLLPPELYHLAFAPHHETLPNRTQGPSPSQKESQPHMTHDHVHLTEDLPLNQRGSDFGRPPPPPPRFPEVPLHPQLHPPLHNVGVSTPSDEIVVEAADVMPDSSLHLIFSLPSIFVGLHGQVEISFTEDPLKEDPETWEGKEVVSTPGDIIESRRLEYTIPGYNGKNGLEPNKNYRVQIALLLRGLRNSPTSRIIKIRTPPRQQESTTLLPPQIEVDAELGIAEVNATWARFVWRKFNDFELQFIDGVQLRYKEVEVKVYSTTQLLHRATGSYTLEGLKPSSTYEVGLLLVPFPGQKTELLARETLHITTAAEKDPYGFDLKIKVDAVKATSAEVNWSGVPYPEDKYVNIFRVIYQSDSANTKGGEGSDGADGEERSSTFKVAKRDPSPSALVKNLKPGTRYRMWLEAYLTNGKIKKSDVKDIVTKPSSSASTTKQGKLEASAGEVGKSSTEEAGDYYGGLVGVSILAALAIVAILILLLMLLKRQGQAKKAAISTARKSESAYDNPTYKTSDHDSTNGRIKNSVRLQEA